MPAIPNTPSRSQLASTTSGREGAALIGTDSKANLGSATTVEAALTSLNTLVGAGLVTAVTASSPLASSGGTTPAISFETQSTHYVLCGPSVGGSPAAPTFRTLVAGDIPSLDASKITSGVLAIARLASGTPDGTKFVRDDGTLAVPAATFSTQTANTILAGPGTGSPATPTFRALVAADIPSLAASIITTGTVATARLGSGTANSSTFLRGDQAWAAPTYASPTLFTATDGSTVTFDLANSTSQIVTLGGSRTLAVSNDNNNVVFDIQLKQDGTGSRTVTWFSGITWPGGSPPTLTSTANKKDWFLFRRTGSGTYDGLVIATNM